MGEGSHEGGRGEFVREGGSRVAPPEVQAELEQRGEAVVTELYLLGRELRRFGHGVVVHVHAQPHRVRVRVEACGRTRA